jgi:hypothetical protein
MQNSVIRETEEETGYRLTSQDYGYMSPGAVTWYFIYVMNMTNPWKEAAALAHEGNIDVMEMSCFDRYASGEIKDAKTISCAC